MGKVRLRLFTKGGISFFVVTRSMLIASTTSPSRSQFLYRISLEGISSRHGLHQLAQKFRNTTFPRKSDRRTPLSTRSVSSNEGASFPTVRGSYLALWID